MEYKQGRELKEFDHLYKMQEDIYHAHRTEDRAFRYRFSGAYSMMGLATGVIQKDICNLYSISKQTVKLFHQISGSQGPSGPQTWNRTGYCSYTLQIFGRAFARKTYRTCF
jgi:hypothetical protein